MGVTALEVVPSEVLAVWMLLEDKVGLIGGVDWSLAHVFIAEKENRGPITKACLFMRGKRITRIVQ